MPMPSETAMKNAVATNFPTTSAPREAGQREQWFEGSPLALACSGVDGDVHAAEQTGEEQEVREDAEDQHRAPRRGRHVIGKNRNRSGNGRIHATQLQAQDTHHSAVAAERGADPNHGRLRRSVCAVGHDPHASRLPIAQRRAEPFADDEPDIGVAAPHGRAQCLATVEGVRLRIDQVLGKVGDEVGGFGRVQDRNLDHLLAFVDGTFHREVHEDDEQHGGEQRA